MQDYTISVECRLCGNKTKTQNVESENIDEDYPLGYNAKIGGEKRHENSQIRVENNWQGKCGHYAQSIIKRTFTGYSS